MFQLLKCVARAVVKNGGKFLLNLVPGGEALSEIVVDTWEQWRQKRDEASLRDELQALAQASPHLVRGEVQAAVQAEAGGQSPNVQQALTAYLTQVPATIKCSLRRPSDPTGTTVPAGCHLNKPEDLLRFLPPRPPRFKAGDRPLPGVDWELVELLGIGGFGEVWKAKNPHMASVPPVALKFCLDPGAAKVLRHEAAVLDRVMRQGRHPAIVQLQHTYLSADPLCLEYEYVDGGDLTGLMQDSQSSHGGMAPPQAAKVLLRLAEVVGYAHRLSPPIVHRDLKPANILVQRGADGKRTLRIADFGIGGVAAGQALQQSRHGTTRGQFLTTAVRGAHTPLYASPEQMRGEAPDPCDDVHALGVIWYQLLTGDLTAGAPSGLTWPNELRQRGMSERQIQLLASCLEGRAANRPPDASAVADVLANEVRAEAVPAGRPVAPPPKPSRARVAAAAQALPPQAAVPDDKVDTLAGRMERVRVLEDLRRLLGCFGSVEKARRIRAANPVAVVCGCVFAIVVGFIILKAVGNFRMLIQEAERLYPDSRFGQFDSDYSSKRSAYIREHDNHGTAVTLCLVSGGLSLFAPCLLVLGWKAIQVAAAKTACAGQIEQLLEDFPGAVRQWGGERSLRSAAAVQELIRGLEAAPGDLGP